MTRVRLLEMDPDELGHAVPREDATPEVTVILPLHNAAEHVDAALAKVQRLEGVSFELVAVDDGSSDGTWERMQAAALSMPVTLIRLKQNAGVATARNIALRAAAGRYAWMIDGDDEWPADALASLLHAAETSGAGMVVARAEKVVVSTGERTAVTVPARSGAYDQRQMLVALLDGGLRGHLWNKLFRLDRLPEDPFPQLRSKSDYHMIIDALPRIGDMYVSASTVYEYRYQLGSITNSKKATPLDLLRCYEAAMRAVAATAWERYPAREVERFRYFSIAQIVMSEIWRFGSRAVNGAEAERYVRGMLTWRGLLRLLPASSPSQFAAAFALKAAPDLLGRVYRRRRYKRWTPVSEG